jgi:hypothetical protein
MQVEQAGNPVSYVISLGYNIQSQQGIEAVDFHGALFSFCMELCLRNVGWEQYQPFPLLNDPPQPMPDVAPGIVEPEPQLPEVPVPDLQDELHPEPLPDLQPDPQPMPQAVGADAPPEDTHVLQAAPAVPPHLLGPNVGVVAPFVVPPNNPEAVGEGDAGVIELD